MITIREMQIDDLEQVMPIEEANFSIPWTETGFFTFLIRDDALFLVASITFGTVVSHLFVASSFPLWSTMIFPSFVAIEFADGGIVPLSLGIYTTSVETIYTLVPSSPRICDQAYFL